MAEKFTKVRKIVELTPRDWEKLQYIMKVRECVSIVDALRQCIRETHQLDQRWAEESSNLRNYLGDAEYDKFLEDCKRRKESSGAEWVTDTLRPMKFCKDCGKSKFVDTDCPYCAIEPKVREVLKGLK